MCNELKKISSGKVREIYDVGNDQLLIVTTDRISAFDVIMPTLIKDKGKVLNQISAFWFNYTKDIVANHMISTDVGTYPDSCRNHPELEGRSMLVEKLNMLPVECVVSGYLTGSNWKNYQKTGTVCGMTLPEGLRESQKLPEPIFCPSTKAPAGEHDEYITFEQMKELVGGELAEQIKEKSIAVYKAGSEYAVQKGIIIADTKFEFGQDDTGNLILGDEILTPDSSRFWPMEEYREGTTPKSYDKQPLRDWLAKEGLAGVVPPPELPDYVVAFTSEKYHTAYQVLTS